MRKKKALYNIVSNLLMQVIILLYGFIVPRIIIGHYGSDVNGLISSITRFLAYITLLESGFGPVVKSILYKPLANNKKDEIANIIYTSENFFRKIALIFVIYIFILMIIYPIIISNEFNAAFTASLIIIIGISTFCEYYFGITYRLLLQADQKSYVFSYIHIITYIISLIVIVLLASCNVSIQLLKLSSCLIFMARPIIQNIYVKKTYGLDFSNVEGNYKIKQKWDGLAQHIAYVIHEGTDAIVLTIFTTLKEVSVYSIYSMVMIGIKTLIQSLINGIEATFGDIIARKEKINLNKKFMVYESMFDSVCTIVFSSAIILIVPFVSVYTKGITDANYIRNMFGYLIVIGEYVWAIRQPYNILIKCSGHFKETRIGAWVECISNIVISIILVRRYGLIGVAIGTIVAMTIRTIEFVYHTNKYILERSIRESVKKILLVIVETLIIVFICKYLPYVDNISYINWIINAIMVTCIASIVTLFLNYLFFKNEFKEAMKMFKELINLKRPSYKI